MLEIFSREEVHCARYVKRSRLTLCVAGLINGYVAACVAAPQLCVYAGLVDSRNVCVVVPLAGCLHLAPYDENV